MYRERGEVWPMISHFGHQTYDLRIFVIYNLNLTLDMRYFTYEFLFLAYNFSSLTSHIWPVTFSIWYLIYAFSYLTSDHLPLSTDLSGFSTKYDISYLNSHIWLFSHHLCHIISDPFLWCLTYDLSPLISDLLAFFTYNCLFQIVIKIVIW